MIYILTVKAWADFDIPYFVPVCGSDNFESLNTIKRSLNQYCKEHSKCNNDVSLLTELNNPRSDLYDIILNASGDEERAVNIYQTLENICNHNNVLISGNAFAVEKVVVV